MSDLLVFLLLAVGEFFASLFQADDRPRARAFTVGCGAILALAVVLAAIALTR